MWKWFRWVLLGIGILFIGLIAYMYFRYVVWMSMGRAEVKKAQAALAQGIKIDDLKNDFVVMGEDPNENNQSPYPLDFSDIKNAQVGADSENIYIKVTFQSIIPKQRPSINNDKIIGIGNKLHIMNSQGIDQVVLHFDTGWQPVSWAPGLNTMYDYCNTGIEWPEEARMSCRGRDSKIFGGNGTDYLLASIPMKNIGLVFGQTIYLSINQETNSQRYGHAAVDLLQGAGRMPGFITWKVGSSQYNIENTEKYQSGY